jgi:hypothetical protein
VDRCALFVDAGYVLADGAMAVHGTRRRESVSWNYEGLLQLFASLATERSGLPLLRCYWYEATVEGRRSADHDVLADLPGVKLRLAKMRPGRREGVESEIHRDLETLARNKAISEAMVVSAEEDLAQVVADVQDLGLRVTLLHIADDADWTISRALRQECDDIVEINSEHLRPYVELISGAEPARADEGDGAPLIALRQTANGHGQPARTAGYSPVPMGPDTGSQLQPPGHGAPAVPVPAVPAPAPAAAPAPVPAAAAPELPARPDLHPVGYDAAPAAQEPPALRMEIALAPADFPAGSGEPQPAMQGFGAPADGSVGPGAPVHPDMPARPDYAVPQGLYAAPVAAPVAADDQPTEFPAARSRQAADLSGYNPGAVREYLPRDAASREQPPGDAGDGLRAVPVTPPSAQIHRLPSRGAGMPPKPPGQPIAGQPSMGQPPAGQPVLSPATAAQPAIGQPVAPAGPVPGFVPSRNGSYSGPQPVAPAGPPPNPAAFAGGQPGVGVQGVPGPAGPVAPVAPVAPLGPLGQAGPNGPVYSPAQGAMDAGAPGLAGVPGYPGVPPSVSLAEAVQSAHDEGQEFGASVARDAPALWLEAVLARKPRMPSDLEARLLQGSALPIDFLLHDEVRHALRRGFWDALERARR